MVVLEERLGLHLNVGMFQAIKSPADPYSILISEDIVNSTISLNFIGLLFA